MPPTLAPTLALTLTLTTGRRGAGPGAANAGAAVGVTFAAFTSDGDQPCTDAETRAIYDALPPPRLLQAAVAAA